METAIILMSPGSKIYSDSASLLPVPPRIPQPLQKRSALRRQSPELGHGGGLAHPRWTIPGDLLQLIFPTYKKSASMLRSLQSALSSTNSQVLVQSRCY